MGWRERAAAWCAARYRLDGLRELATHKTVPVHRHSLWYYFGGVTLFFFGIQLVTGILLLLYYKPTTEAAFESVRFIMTRVEFGWLVRSLHAWSAHLMILSAMAHLVSVFFLKAYRPPRELTWVVGVAAFLLLLGFGFTGYLLPWNTVAFFATKVGTEIAGSAPLVGPFLRLVLRGGEEVGDATLGRFFAVHVVVLPLVVLGLVAVHLAMIQVQGMSVPPSVERRGGCRQIPFFPDFFLRDLVAWTIAFGVAVSLAVYFPAELGQKADPFAPTPVGIKPEWYFLWMFQTLKLLPSRVGVLEGELVGIGLTGAAMIALLLVPFLDRRLRRGEPNPLVMSLGLGALAYVIAMTVWGMVR